MKSTEIPSEQPNNIIYLKDHLTEEEKRDIIKRTFRRINNKVNKNLEEN